MKRLDKQSHSKNVEIQVGDEIYRFKNPYHNKADELQFTLAEEIYNFIKGVLYIYM